MRLRQIWAPLGVLVVAAAVFGYLFGQRVAAPRSETETINRWAAEYVTWAGGLADVTDCVARPDPRDDVWMVIDCRPARGDGPQKRYEVGYDGDILR